MLISKLIPCYVNATLTYEDLTTDNISVRDVYIAAQTYKNYVTIATRQNGLSLCRRGTIFLGEVLS